MPEDKIQYKSRAKSLILALGEKPNKSVVKFSDGSAYMTAVQEELAKKRPGYGYEFWPVGFRSIAAISKAKASIAAQIAELEARKNDLLLLEGEIENSRVKPEAAGSSFDEGSGETDPVLGNSYESMTVKELRSLVEEREMNVVTNAKKEQLIAALQEFDKASQEPQP